MIIIGEKLNSSIKPVREATAARNAEFIGSLAKAQSDAGASWLDINAAMLPDEADSLVWLGTVCRSVCDTPLAIDTPDAQAAGFALEKLGGRCLINSVTLESSRYDAMSALAVKHGCPLVALCMDDGGAPETVADRVRISVALRDRLTADGVAESDIFIDPMISPVGAVETAGRDALSVISQLRAALGTHIVCGLSNVSYGLPARPYINRAFMVAAMAAGLDCMIANPLDIQLMRLCRAAQAMLGLDEYCENYIDSYRAGFFED